MKKLLDKLEELILKKAKYLNFTQLRADRKAELIAIIDEQIDYIKSKILEVKK